MNGLEPQRFFPSSLVRSCSSFAMCDQSLVSVKKLQDCQGVLRGGPQLHYATDAKSPADSFASAWRSKRFVNVQMHDVKFAVTFYLPGV